MNRDREEAISIIKSECYAFNPFNLDRSTKVNTALDIAIEVLSKKCHNINKDYDDCDQFVCSNCGIELQDWHQVERDEDDGDITYHEYKFRFCPNCGARIVKEDEL
jgi:DNA-directed RNA polymerase subunit RPC12/RpoP